MMTETPGESWTWLSDPTPTLEASMGFFHGPV